MPVHGAMREPGFSHKRSAVKAIIFDCFGVLAEDGWLPFKRTYIGDNEQVAQAVADLGKQNEYGIIGNEDYIRQSAAIIGVDEQALRAAVGKRVPNVELFDFIKTELKPRYKIGLLSNANYDVLHDLFTPDQAAVFDASVMSFESKMIKPDPRMFMLIAKRLDVAMDECVFVDDVARYVTAAEELGMQALLYNSPTRLQQDLLQLLK